MRFVSGPMIATLLAGTLAISSDAHAQASSAKPAKSKNRSVATAPSAGTLTIRVAIVLPDLSIRPVPSLGVETIDLADSTRRISSRTTLDGTLAQTLSSGHYVVRSVAPLTVGDSTYRWEIPLEMTARSSTLELTNANATATAAKRTAVRQVAPERQVFETVRRGVVRVQAGLGRGSGFLAKLAGGEPGLVVTNDHVVADDSVASVYLDSVTHVRAVVVARDRNADLAILRVPASRVGDRPSLSLASSTGDEPLVVAGERIMAIGYPLNQEMTLTTGIVSSVRAGAIVSDVNINHGNSGGPMLNLAGEVVGVNAFGDMSSAGGPGISGAIAISRIAPLLTTLPAALAASPFPSDSLLPAMPTVAYPVAALKEAAEMVDVDEYRSLLTRDADHFVLNIITPVMQQVSLRQHEGEVAEERRKREAAAGVSKDQAYSETRQTRDWEQYVGENAPVVAIAISPKVGETAGSTFLRAMMGASGALAQASLVFQSDVRGAHFYRNGVEVEPITGGHGPVVENVENRFIKLKDVADRGYYVLPPELFRPDSDGAPARVRVAIKDLMRPGETSGTEIEGERSARVWNDFKRYYQVVHSELPFVAANPRMRSPRAEMDCEAGSCRLVTQHH